MVNKILKIENLSKLYRLGQIGTGTISHDLNRWWSKIYEVFSWDQIFYSDI